MHASTTFIHECMFSLLSLLHRGGCAVGLYLPCVRPPAHHGREELCSLSWWICICTCMQRCV